MSLIAIILVATVLLCLGALGAAFAARSDRTALVIGTITALSACLAGVGASAAALLRADQASLRLAWSFPVGELHFGLDGLAAFFLLCIFLVSGLAALYGSGSLRSDFGRRRVAPAVVFFNLLVAAMVALVLARDAVLFLLCWELMSLASFFLVAYEHDREEVRRAGLVYLVASQLGVVFLFVLFALLASRSSSYDFDVLISAGAPSAALANTCFLLAVVGFGAKAGFWPFHVWLPEAHPAAPSHVSAVMSGVMIKMGIYGLLRTLTFLGEPPAWWGVSLILIGAASGMSGVLQALAERDLKRMLAYSSVENVGIITLGLGVGLLGRAQSYPLMAALATAGAVLHVLNHGLFKGLLFMGAGSVVHASATREMDSLGGLQRRMPVTALTFLVGAAAISGLPPLNGFVGEWLVYVGAFRGGAVPSVVLSSSALLVIPALALIGGLGAACFVRAFGIVFLGEPRSRAAGVAHEANLAMRVPMVTAALLCAAVGLWPTGPIELVLPAVPQGAALRDAAGNTFQSIQAITRVALALLALAGGLALGRRLLLRGREVTVARTWSCGYADSSPRMQYTGSSYAQLALSPFSAVLHARAQRRGPDGYFPTSASHEETIGDLAGERVFAGMARVVAAVAKLRVLQQGRLHLYLVYIAAALVVLLVWQLTGGQGR